jgi:hypothetical protein
MENIVASPSFRIVLCNGLENIYMENLGECIVYLWIEEIRNFLVNTVSPHTESPPDVPALDLPEELSTESERTIR